MIIRGGKMYSSDFVSSIAKHVDIYTLFDFAISSKYFYKSCRFVVRNRRRQHNLYMVVLKDEIRIARLFNTKDILKVLDMYSITGTAKLDGIFEHILSREQYNKNHNFIHRMLIRGMNVSHIDSLHGCKKCTSYAVKGNNVENMKLVDIPDRLLYTTVSNHNSTAQYLLDRGVRKISMGEEMLWLSGTSTLFVV